MLGRRADGYHELLTIFQTISLHDLITFSYAPRNRITLTCDVSEIPTGADNLIVLAAELLRQRFDVESGVEIHLEKRIPAGGGLGGGSSDAAITILGLALLWKIELTRADMEEIGRQLGADVPFFFTGGTALGTGTGTDISSINDAPFVRLLIVTPDVKVSTQQAYKALNAPALTKVVGDTILSSSRLNDEFSNSLYGSLKNDFESMIFNAVPEIMHARDVLLREGARGALMSGSGASVFGIFDSEAAQERAANVIRSETGWRVFECVTLSRNRYLKELGDCAVPLHKGFPFEGSFDIGA